MVVIVSYHFYRPTEVKTVVFDVLRVIVVDGCRSYFLIRHSLRLVSQYCSVHFRLFHRPQHASYRQQRKVSLVLIRYFRSSRSPAACSLSDQQRDPAHIRTTRVQTQE
jgi:hypothetical protein